VIDALIAPLNCTLEVNIVTRREAGGRVLTDERGSASTWSVTTPGEQSKNYTYWIHGMLFLESTNHAILISKPKLQFPSIFFLQISVLRSKRDYAMSRSVSASFEVEGIAVASAGHLALLGY
jgi:hypothetical protein